MNPPLFNKNGVMVRRPQRVSVTLTFGTYSTLSTMSVEQGRSLSNLCAYLLERAVERQP